MNKIYYKKLTPDNIGIYIDEIDSIIEKYELLYKGKNFEYTDVRKSVI